MFASGNEEMESALLSVHCSTLKRRSHVHDRQLARPAASSAVGQMDCKEQQRTNKASGKHICLINRYWHICCHLKIKLSTCDKK